MREDSRTSSSSRWRDDPLSAVLLCALVLLMVMFSVDEARKRSILAGAQDVAALDAPMGDACSLSQAGPGGDTLLVRCRGVSLAGARARAADAFADGLPEPFDAIALRDDSGTLFCRGAVSTWAEQSSCTEPVAPLGPDEMERALRRRRRAEE
ncbi:MAG: hypothetical protein AAGI01_01310 [Myxococcota bacterium]